MNCTYLEIFLSCKSLAVSLILNLHTRSHQYVKESCTQGVLSVIFAFLAQALSEKKGGHVGCAWERTQLRSLYTYKRSTGGMRVIYTVVHPDVALDYIYGDITHEEIPIREK